MKKAFSYLYREILLELNKYLDTYYSDEYEENDEARVVIDLGTEDNCCYPRELGEIHDTFNVVINQGSGNPITLTRVVIRSSQDEGSYLQSMVDVLSKLRNNYVF